MSTALKRVISLLLVLFVAAASLVLIPPVNASAASQVKYKVGYSGNYVYLKLIPQKSTNKIYYTTDGNTATRKSTRYKKVLAAKSMTFIRVVEYTKNNKKVASLNIVIKPRVRRPKTSVTSSGNSVYVTLTSATPGAKIYYTTDGSKPTKKSKLYTGAIKCKVGTVIRARAFKKNMNNSKITQYTVKKPANTVTTQPEPSVSDPDETVDLTGYIDVETGDNITDDQSGDTVDEPVQPAESDIDGVLRIINEERTKVGVSKLTLDSMLCAAAAVRAKELEKKYDHERPDGTDCFTVLYDYGIIRNAKGENIAMGMNTMFTPAEVMDKWMNSRGHRNNILSTSFGRVGIGVYKAGSYVYWVQIFTD